MGRRWKMDQEADPKARLVREICSVSSAFDCCTHRRPRGTATFIDWYLILRIDDSAGLDLVRRRYRHLALQLHPDKNKHPQAEVAFKLVSEAYACLTDDARRRAFDIERRDSACQKCISRGLRRPADNRGAPPRGDTDDEEPAEVASDVRMPIRSSSSSTTNRKNILRALEELGSRIREDAVVVDNCLRARQAQIRRVVDDQSATTSPVFDPSDRRLYPDYPHHRIPVVSREIINSYVDHAAGRYAPSYDGKRGWPL